MVCVFFWFSHPPLRPPLSLSIISSSPPLHTLKQPLTFSGHPFPGSLLCGTEIVNQNKNKAKRKTPTAAEGVRCFVSSSDQSSGGSGGGGVYHQPAVTPLQKVVRNEFSSSCVTSDARNVRGRGLASEMRQNSGLSIYHLCCLVFFHTFFVFSSHR